MATQRIEPDVSEDEVTVRILADQESCPHCGKSLIGEAIPPSRREFFGGRTHASRIVAVEVAGRTAFYRCPDCGESISATFESAAAGGPEP